MADKTTVSGGIGFGGALFILFLGLRLTDHIDWAWYWVASPLWIPLGLVLGIWSLIGFVALVAHTLDGIARRRRRAKRRNGAPRV